MSKYGFENYESLALLYIVEEALELEATGLTSGLVDIVGEAKDCAVEVLYERGVLNHEAASGIENPQDDLTFEEAVAEAIGIERERLRKEALAKGLYPCPIAKGLLEALS